MTALRSIRFRLPLTYAVIALLAALMLGAVLLTVLRSYYAAQEYNYLQNNAQSIRDYLSQYLRAGFPIEALSGQLNSLAFLSKTRITYKNAQGNILLDTGQPDSSFVVLSPSENQPEESAGGWNRGRHQARIEVFSSNQPNAPWGGLIEPPRGEGFADLESILANSMENLLQELSLSITPAAPSFRPIIRSGSGLFGFSLTDNPAPTEQASRSDQTIGIDVTNPSGAPIGSIVLSEGPSYGSEIVDSVARAWSLASGISVLMAALVGWFISQQISRPLTELTRATVRMAGGDLTARTHLQRGDEIGTLAAAFNDMAARIEVTISTLKRFVADAAHELHTPLTAVRTNLELAREKSSPEALTRALEQIDRLKILADDLLALSRIEAQPDFSPQEKMDLAALIGQMAELYASRADQAGLDFELEIDQAPAYILGGHSQLQRLIENLLDNAIKFTPPEGKIRLSLRRNQRFFELRVEDSGIGIPPDDLPFLFERFRRGRNVSGYPGSGLGLAIVRAIVSMHHGQVEAESSPAGTKMLVSLPAAS